MAYKVEYGGLKSTYHLILWQIIKKHKLAILTTYKFNQNNCGFYGLGLYNHAI